MNIQQMLADAEKIVDPVEREKELNRISALILGNPNRAAVTPAIATVPVEAGAVVDQTKRPTIENAQVLDQLTSDAILAEKAKGATNLDTFNDDELEKLINGFSSTVPEAMASDELAARKRIDDQNILQNVVDPKAIKRFAGQVVEGTGEIATSSPIALAGLMGKGLELVTQQPLIKNPAGETVFDADMLLKAASEISEDMHNSVGISQPRDITESAAGFVPNLISVPGKSATTLLGNAAEIITPLVVGGGNKRILANFATGLVADQAMRELGDEAGDPYKTIFDKSGLSGNALWDDRAHPLVQAGLSGALGLFLTGTLIGPQAAKMMRDHKVLKGPTLKDITSIDLSAPKNLKTFETAGDLFKTYTVDEKTVLSSFARRAGMPDYDLVTNLIDHDTQMAAIMKINEAMRTGKLYSMGGTYSVKNTPDQIAAEVSRLPKAMQEDADLYMKYHDFADDLNLRINKNVNAQNAPAQLQQVQKLIYDIEQRSPVVKDIADKYRSATEAVRKYLGQGPNAMLSPKALAELDKNRKNYVPIAVNNVDPNAPFLERIADASVDIDQSRLDDWYLQNRDIANINGITGRSNSFEVLSQYTRNAIKAKLEHDVRGAYIRSMMASIHGGETMRPVKPEEVGKYRDRVVEVYEGGEKKQYLSSKLQAQLLKFDPYVAKYPDMYFLKRLFERGTTGPLSGTFAATTALRDSLAGWVFTPKGMKGPIGKELLTAVPKQVWAKTQLAAIDILRGGMKNIPFLDQAARDQLATQISSSYMNSMYHLANENSGFDASLMKTNIENARGIMHEIARTTGAVAEKIPGVMPVAGGLRAMAHGFGNIFDAVQEMPRFAMFERNVKAGMAPSDAAREAKLLTGDNTRSGRVYSPMGDRLDADAVNKGMKAFAKPIGATTEFLRESTPYLNPMIQGLRRAGNAFIDDPIRTNLRAWTAVGLPSLIMMGWNEWLGEEYNKFAFQERSSRDIAMNMYLGIPGLPPEQGIQIPVAHELTLWNSPWTTGLYAMMKGATGDEVNAMIKHMAAASLSNAAMVGFPQIGSVIGAAAGVHAPESINPFSWQDDTYELREDNVGVFPQNTELMLRNMFGGISETVLQSAAAGWEGGPEAFFEELGHQYVKKAPIVKNLAGTTTPVTNFTPLSEERQAKVDSLYQFIDMYEAHLLHPGTLRSNPASSTKGLVEETDQQTTANLGPLPTPTPTNAIVMEYGPMIKSVLDGNAEGYTGLKSRYGILSDQLRLLKGYNAGRADQFAEWRKSYQGKDDEYQAAMKKLQAQQGTMKKKEYEKAMKNLNDGLGEFAKADRLVKSLKLDLSKRGDVTKLVSVLERERMTLLQAQLKMIAEVEDRVTADLQQRGLLQPGKKFDVTKHLGLSTPKDLILQPQQ